MLMRPVSQLDIAPTIAAILGLNMSELDGKPLEEVADWKIQNVVLVIIDSLGYNLYRTLEPDLKFIPQIASKGLLLKAEAVSNHTSPAIASILCGLLPEHHKILDTKGAKRSTIRSIPEIASHNGLKSAVIMEKGGFEVYEGRIEIARGVPDTLDSFDFDREICRHSLGALSHEPRLLVTYFIGIDKTVHKGSGYDGIKKAAISIDGHVGEIIDAALPETMIVLCGDHPIHAGPLKRSHSPYCVPLILGKKQCHM